MTAMRPAAFADRLVEPPGGGRFGPEEAAGLPDPVRRYFAAAIAPGTILARSARFAMRGAIRIGGRWLRFRASQVESPHRGFLWTARAGAVITGHDRYAGGVGDLDWRVLGLVRVAHAAGPDVSRSAAGRAGAEAVWVPTALLPRFGVAWNAEDDRHVTASYRLDRTSIDLRLTLQDDGRVASVVFDRWGDPDSTGAWGTHPFGFEVTGHATFDGVTIPAAGRAGWHFGGERWPAGAFFRARITRYRLLTGSGGATT